MKQTNASGFKPSVTVTSHRTAMGRLLLMTLLLFAFMGGAKAQQALPYEYGFENNDLSADGWVLQGSTSINTGISTSAKQTDTYGFQFTYSEHNAYLLSPILTGGENGIEVSFWYKNYSGGYPEHFKVGYTTDEAVTDASVFTYGDEIIGTTSWQEYTNVFPAGTKRIAIQYIYTDAYYLFLDDFSFTVPAAVAKPTDLAVSYTGGTTATVSWTSNASAFDIDVNGVVTENVTNPYTLTGLSLGTTYTIKVQAKSGTDVSGWTRGVSFTTDYPAQTLPYEYGFESDFGPWTLVDCAASTGVKTDAKRNGSYGFQFSYNTAPPQYLISPELVTSGSSVEVSFYYKNPSSYTETFKVGYSTTTKAPSAFTWGDEITAPKEWTMYVNTFPAGTKFVAVAYTANDQYHMYLDDFSFDINDGFAKPTDLVASDVTNKTAVLSWTEKGSATAWVIELTDNGEEETTYIDASTNPFTLTKLTPETEYFVRVRQAGDDNTKWSDGIFFTTDIALSAPVALAANNITANSATISWTGTADSYNLRYATVSGFFDDFENGMDQWTIYTEGEAPVTEGWYAYDATGITDVTNHSGSAVASAWSWYANVAYDADNWLVTPQVDFGGTLKFWVRTNSGYPDKYEVLLSTTGNAIADFTTTLQAMATAPAVAAWTEVVIDLSAYAGQQGYIAIHHVSNDCNYLLIDDFSVTTTTKWTTVNSVSNPYTLEGLTPDTKYQVQVQSVYTDGESTWTETKFTTLEDVATPSGLAASDVTYNTAVLSWTENGDATAWEICLNDDETNLIAADSNPFTLNGLTPETDYTAKVRAVKGEKRSHWSAATSFATDIQFHAPTDVAAGNITTTSAEISWTADAVAATATGFEVQYAEGNVFGSTLQYDNGEWATSIGTSSASNQTWGVMYPGSMVIASQLTKVSIYETSYNSADITINIYQDGDDAPATLLSTETVTPVGGLHEVTLASPVAITPGKNLWVTLTETGTYVKTACLSDVTNNQWIYNTSNGWYILSVASSTLAGYGWMIRADINDGIDPATTKWTAITNATSPTELTGLTPETTYTARVKAIYGTEGESLWTSTSFRTLTDNPVPSNIVADLVADGATITWDGTGDSYNVQYRTAENTEVFFFDDFTNGLDKWTVITNGEGPGWVIGNETGSYAATAYSYDNDTYTAYDADNWLISPAVTLDGTLNFYVATASNYPDSYEVLLSTTGTDITDFTTTLQAMASATTGYVTIDLSAYSGTGYIAIHHVSQNQLILAIDDFGIYGASTPAGEWQEMAVTDATATLSGLATNNAYEYQIQSVKGSKTSEWSELGEFALLTLDDAGTNNSSLILNNVGRQAHVTLAGRTLYKDDSWNTICLPFDIDDLDESPLAGATAKKLTAATMTGTTVSMTFTEYPIHSGIPYIIKWAKDTNIENPQFANVTISATQGYTLSYSDDNVKFIGYFDAFGITAADEDIYYMTADSKLKHTGKDRTLNACRAYFQFSEEAAAAREFILDFGDETTTGTQSIDIVKTGNETDGTWYTVEGVTLDKQPTRKGLYINNGRKVVVK